MSGYKFQSDWLQRKDVQNYEVGTWCESCRDIQHFAYCRVCKKKFSYSAKGFWDILLHSSSTKHGKNMEDHVNVNQLKLEPIHNQESNETQMTVKLCSMRDKTA